MNNLKIRPNENRKSDRLGQFTLMQITNFEVINFGVNKIPFFDFQNNKIYNNQDLCTVYGCEKPSIYAGFRLITITLLRPKIQIQLYVEFGFFCL